MREALRRLVMKKLMYLLTMAAFVFSVTMAVAEGPAKPGAKAEAAKPAKGVDCCVKGACKSVPTAADCAKAGGKVVKDCKECK
jgi:hypothetical protein